MSLKENHFLSLKALKEITPLTETEMLEERRQAYIKEIKEGIVDTWMHRGKFYDIKVKAELYNPKTLCHELEELGYFPEYIWQCGTIIVYFKPRTAK